MTARTQGRGFRGTARAGKDGELELAHAYKGCRTGTSASDESCAECRACDILVLTRNAPLRVHYANAGKNALHVEVKTDTYDPSRTPFMFMERWTKRPDGTLLPGGPWRAAEHRIEAFVYYYPKGRLAVWMWDLPALVAMLDERKDGAGWRKVSVHNPEGYTAYGRLVPRDDVRSFHAAYEEHRI